MKCRRVFMQLTGFTVLLVCVCVCVYVCACMHACACVHACVYMCILHTAMLEPLLMPVLCVSFFFKLLIKLCLFSILTCGVGTLQISIITNQSSSITEYRTVTVYE